MTTLFLLFSHAITPDQVEDAQKNWGVESVESLPTNLQESFSNVPADLEDLTAHLQPIKDWLLSRAKPTDLVLIQGDFGVTYHLVDFCKKQGLTAIYATTERQSIDTMQPDGSILTQRVFKHKIFRKY